jgi:hypothetical protein
MKALSASLLTIVLAALPLMGSTANDKVLQNIKGTVTYGPSATPTTSLAPKSSIALNDNDYTATGADSQAAITLPDSSRVLIGQNSNVQLAAFDNSVSPTSAKFVVVGKVRFTVQHPAGAQANYQFSTQTGQIAVRGTEGDIDAPGGAGGAPGGLQVNVYALSNPALPVQVTLVNGQVFTLAAGQSLVVTAAAGALVGAVSGISQALTTPFSEFGAAANGAGGAAGGAAGAAGSAGGGAAAGGAATGAAVTAGVVGAAVVGTVAVANSKSSSAPAPTAQPTNQPTQQPTTQPSSTSVPIVISGAHGPASPPPTPQAVAPIPAPPASHAGGRPPEPRG